MKTIHICPSYKPAYIYGGPIMSVSKLCEALADAGCSTEMLTTTANGKTTLNVKKNVPIHLDGVIVHYFKCLSNAPTHFSPALLWHLLLKKDIKLIHVHSWWNSAAVLACFLARFKSIPVLLSPRGMITHYTFQKRNIVVKWLIHKFIGNKLLEYCHVHASTEKEKIDMLSYINPRSITVIPNIIRLPEIIVNDFPSSDLPPRVRLIFLSRVEEKKGLGILFGALSKLNFKWELTIAGTGEPRYMERLKSLGIRLGIASSVKWIGHVYDDQEKFNLLAKHELMILPSHNESFANVVLESLLAGTPVVISDQVGLADYVHEKSMGWVSKLTVDDFSHTITNAYENRTQRERIRQQAPDIIKEDFSDQHLINQYLRLYKSIAKNG